MRAVAMRLTAAHLSKVHRDVADTGTQPGVFQQTDADYADWVARTIAAQPEPGTPIRLFAYGSLIWKPEIAHVGETVAVARGWRRSFCLRQTRFRGTPESPGLMLALDRGGQCKGVLFDLPAEPVAPQLDALFRREFTIKPINNIPRWIRVDTDVGKANALAFVMNRCSPAYAGRLMPEEVADVLAWSCGPFGTGAEYLLNTVSHLEARGLRDAGLWRLQALVADRIDSIS